MKHKQKAEKTLPVVAPVITPLKDTKRKSKARVNVTPVITPLIGRARKMTVVNKKPRSGK
jgi:hypothetical protein